MKSPSVFVLTRLGMDEQGNVTSKNVGATFSLHEAEIHRSKGVEYDFEVFRTDGNWQEDAATTDLVVAMREFCGMVREWQEAALR
jgi:hypothetical protein